MINNKFNKLVYYFFMVKDNNNSQMYKNKEEVFMNQ